MLFTFQNKRLNSIIEKVLMALVFVWPLFFIAKGIDHMDSGYYLASYKYFFDATIENYVPFELTNFFGALLYHIAPEAKFLFFRVIDYIFNCVSWIFTYKLAKNLLPKIWIWGGILIASFAIRRYPMMLSYNSFSFTFMIVAMYYLKIGIENNIKKYIFISGLIVGFNVFFRLPNALQALFVLVPLLYAISFSKTELRTQLKLALKQSLNFTAAGFIGLSIGFLITLLIEGWSGITGSIQNMLHLSANGSHSMSVVFYNLKMIYTAASTQLKAYIPWALLAILLVFVFYKFILKNDNKIIETIFIAVLLFITLYFTYREIFTFSEKFLINLVAVFLIMLSALSLIINYKKTEAYLYSLIAFVVIILTPLGTDNIYNQYVFVMPFLLLNIFILLNNIKQPQTQTYGHIVKLVINIFASVLVLTIGLGFTVNYLLSLGYCDMRTEKLNKSVNIKALYGMHTNEEKASALESFYNDMHSDEYYKNHKMLVLGDFLLAYELCENKPFDKYLWNDLDYIDKDKIMDNLVNAEEKPIIVIGKFKCYRYEINNDLSKFIDFATQNAYNKIDNECYTIYLPPKRTEYAYNNK